MKYSVKFFQTDFEGATAKEAYLEACKWIAQNILNKVEIGETFWKVERVQDASLPTYKLELYATIEDNEHTKSFCDKCQEYHKAFFLNQQFNCDRCNMKAHKTQMEQKLRIKKQFRKERLNYILNE